MLVPSYFIDTCRTDWLCVCVLDWQTLWCRVLLKESY